MLLAMITYFDLTGTEPYGIISGIVRDSLLTKDHYSIANSPDKYMNVNGAVVEMLETGDIYHVDSVNTGFYMFDSIPPGTYNLVFSAKDYFNDTVEIEVSPHRFSYHNHWMKADKTMAPKVISSNPANGDTINAFDPVRITFNMNMDSATVADAFNISPEIAGTFSWDKDYLNVYFQPDIPYETVTQYTVTLHPSAEHQWGVALGSTISFSFITGDRNRYLLETSFPINDQAGVSPYLQFRLIFDAPVNNTSLINAIDIISGEGPVLGTKGASITAVDGKGHYYFSPSEELQFNRNYTLKIHGSVKDENNIPLVDAIEIPFTTMEEPLSIVVIDEFDVNNGWTIDFNSSKGIDETSFLYRWTKTKLSGEASTLLRYNFLETGAECVLKPAAGSVGLIENSNMAGLWVWGDLSYNSIILIFDNETEVELSVIDFAGWNFCTAELPDGVSSVVGLKITSSPEGTPGGDIYLDALSQQDLTDIIDKTATNRIIAYPNPVDGNLIRIKNFHGQAAQYHISGLTGKILQQGVIDPGTPFIILEDAVKNEATLILRIVTDTKTYSIQMFNNL